MTRMSRHTIVQMCTVVVGLDATSRIIGICMESIEMSANTLGWGKVLCRASSGFENLVCERLGLTLGLVGGWDLLHDGWMYLLEMYWKRGMESGREEYLYHGKSYPKHSAL
jgi:hypothetical protein